MYDTMKQQNPPKKKISKSGQIYMKELQSTE